LPRQFGEGKHVVFAGDIVPKTLALFLQQSTKAGVVMATLAGVSPVPIPNNSVAERSFPLLHLVEML
jgi:hypothetical protein